MDAARALVTELCDKGGWLVVQREGITPAYLDGDTAPILSYIERHFTQYKKVPGRDAVKHAFPNFAFKDYGENLDYYIKELKESYRRNVLDTKFEELGSIYTKDTMEAERILRETLVELQVTSKTHKDINVAETAIERYENYIEREKAPPEDGILSGWPSLDYQTLGFHPEEFIVLVGEKWVGKSWVMLWLIYKALLQNERVLLATQEMTPEAVIKRLDAIYAGIRFDALRRGELTEAEKTRYKTKMEELHSSEYNLIVARDGVHTIDDLQTKAVETDATILFADSVYLFPPDSSWNGGSETQKRLAISQKCKRMARNLEIPVVASVQAGRKKSKNKVPDLDDIEYSNAFSQDADTVFYVEKSDLDVELKRRKNYLLKSRDGDATEFYFETDFEFSSFEEREGDTDEPTTEIQFDTEDEAGSEEVISYD